MNKKFLNKGFLNRVVSQIVKETIIDYDRDSISAPYYKYIQFTLSHYSCCLFFPRSSFLPPAHFPHFSKHCKEIYILNEQEIVYVWNEYRYTIKDKINE